MATDNILTEIKITDGNPVCVKSIPAIFCWSGGKDSAYALHKVLHEGVYHIKYLLSTFNGATLQLSMHGVKQDLIQAQADSIGLPLLKVYVYEASNAEYEMQMNETLQKVKAEGVETVLYGDIFLEDLRQYREGKMAELEMKCVFPVWKIDTAWLVNDFVAKGFKSYTCCINDRYLDETWAGRLIDESFISELPSTVDPCGEHGEYHSFCFAGPLFKTAINIVVGEKTYKPLLIKKADDATAIKDADASGFWFADMVLL
jgi:uncharacterized protein (TIGR00290 family)